MFFCGGVLTSNNAAAVKCVQIKPSGGGWWWGGGVPLSKNREPPLRTVIKEAQVRVKENELP